MNSNQETGMEITNIMLSGVGGQGILTSGRVLALAAMDAGLDVKMSEVHGMAQRGGNVDTHVRIGKEVPASLIPKGGAHFLVSFEKLEALRYLEYLRPDATAFVSRQEIPPLTQNLKAGKGYVQDLDRILEEMAPSVFWVDAVDIARELGDIRMVNMILLGALANRLPLTMENWEAALAQRFKEKIRPLCRKAFQRGWDHGS
ncbi:MAG: indolepyruvate oxidoreductase subunit beta [Acidobacteriota bacterium]